MLFTYLHPRSVVSSEQKVKAKALIPVLFLQQRCSSYHSQLDEQSSKVHVVCSGPCSWL